MDTRSIDTHIDPTAYVLVSGSCWAGSSKLKHNAMYWRWTALCVYLVICLYDFMAVPIWYGLNRPDLATFIEILNTVKDPLIQLELMKKMTGQHSPFTLMGGGIFHLAFGAILTGSAFGLK